MCDAEPHAARAGLPWKWSRNLGGSGSRVEIWGEVDYAAAVVSSILYKIIKVR